MNQLTIEEKARYVAAMETWARNLREQIARRNERLKEIQDTEFLDTNIKNAMSQGVQSGFDGLIADMESQIPTPDAFVDTPTEE